MIMASTNRGGYDPVARVLIGGPRVTVSDMRYGETMSFDPHTTRQQRVFDPHFPEPRVADNAVTLTTSKSTDE